MSIEECGKIIKCKEEVSFYQKMEIAIKQILTKIIQLATYNSNIVMEIIMMENGKIIKSMALVNFLGEMGTFMKEISLKIK